jgi:hypothetical protein
MIVDKRVSEEDPTQMNEYAGVLDSQALTSTVWIYPSLRA